MEEITAEYASEALSPPPELLFVPKVTVACKTDLGRVRENNEDKFEYFVPEEEAALASKGLVFVVCDGMGGHEAGQIASEMACNTFLSEYLRHSSSDPAAALRGAARAANRLVLDCARAIPSRRGMGTTLSALVLLQDSAWTAHVGDSRIYRLREGFLDRMTRDHTWVEDVVSTGAFSREEAERHQYRHVLTRAIGTEEHLLPDVDRFDLLAGDTYLLCTDGLLNHVSDPRIHEVLESESPGPACWTLVGDALLGGGSDNTTVMVVRIDAIIDAAPASSPFERRLRE